MDFFSIIWTIASIGSIPLSLYLFIKSKENNVDKVKRDIVKTLSHQIGERRQLTSFEIQTVINSKTRELKVDWEKITISQVIEDLVAETISNPLLDRSIKEVIINELKNIYFKSELLTKIDDIEVETRANKKSDVNIENAIKQIIEKRNDIKTEMSYQNRKFSRISENFAFIAIVTTLFGSMVTFSGKEKYDSFAKPIYDFLQNNDFYLSILVSAFAAIASFIMLLMLVSIKKFRVRIKK